MDTKKRRESEDEGRDWSNTATGHHKLEKTRNRFSPRTSRGSMALPTP